MSLLSVAAGTCSSQHRNVIQRSLGAALSHQRTATSQANNNKKPVQKSAQTIGGVRKGRTERWETKIRQQRTKKTFDMKSFTKLPEEKLKVRAGSGQPAVVPKVFQAGIGHTLDLPVFGPETVTAKNIGTVASFDLSSPTNPSNVFGTPKIMRLEFRILSKPCSVIRDITVSTINKLESAKSTPSKDSRLVLSGRAGCGKSYLLHQAVQYATSQGWLVFYVPRATSLMNSFSRYTYDLRTQLFLQTHASYRALARFHRVNGHLLRELRTTEPVVLVQEKVNVPVGTTLAELAEVGLRDRSGGCAVGVLGEVMREVEKQSKFPVLMAIDDFQALYHDSAYKDPFFKPVKAHHLSVPRMLLEYASGKRSFAKGTFLAALTNSSTTYPIPLELRDALALGYVHPTSPYEKRDAERVGYAEGLERWDVPQRMSLGECAGLFGVMKDDGGVVGTRYDEHLLSKYVESDGNPRDFVWKGLLSTFAP